MINQDIVFLIAVIPWGFLVWISIPLGLIGLGVQLIGLIIIIKG